MALPITNPQLPQVVIKNSINPTANTEISSSITIAAAPKAVGYSQWLGYWQAFNAILLVTSSQIGDNAFPSIPATGTVINRGIN